MKTLLPLLALFLLAAPPRAEERHGAPDGQVGVPSPPSAYKGGIVPVAGDSLEDAARRSVARRCPGTEGCQQAMPGVEAMDRFQKRLAACRAAACDDKAWALTALPLHEADGFSGRVARAFPELRDWVHAEQRRRLVDIPVGLPEIAAASVEESCALGRPTCAQMRPLLAELGRLADDARKCRDRRRPCALAEHDALTRRYLGIHWKLHAVASAEEHYWPVIEWFGFIGEARVGALDAEISKALDAHEKSVGELLGRAFALGHPRPTPPPYDQEAVRALARESGKALDEYGRLAVSVDYALDAPGKDDWRPRLNAVAMRLAALRNQLVMLEGMSGLSADPRLDLTGLLPSDAEPDERLLRSLKLGMPTLAGDRPGADLGGGGADPPPGRAHALYASAAQPRPVKDILRAPRVSFAADLVPTVEPPPIAPVYSGAERFFRDLVGKTTERERIAAMRARGRTETVGDPGGRAKFVHAQTGETCAVVTQLQILRAHGAIPDEQPSVLEERLRRLAEEKGFYVESGTPGWFAGSLLTLYGIPTVRHKAATHEELEAAARRGHWLYVAVDAYRLWKRSEPRIGGHAVAVTGAEFEKGTGRLLGYYVNDSGTNPPGKGKFYTAAEFYDAFDGFTRDFTEVL